MKRVLFFFCVSLQVIAQNAVTLKRPIALDKLSSGDLFALTQEGQVYRLQERLNTIQAPISSFTLPTWQSPSDIVSAIVNGQQTILVSGRGLRGGFVAEFSDTGQLRTTWESGHVLAGLDYDFSKGMIYVASADSPEIYQASIREQGKGATYCGTVVGARQLGPVIFDSTRNQLLIGEVENGELYSFNLTTHKSHLITSDLGSPQALLLSQDNQVLFIADAGRRKIYRLDLSKASAVPMVFSSDKVFQEPVGLARLSSGGIVVADDRANALFVLSSQGRVSGNR